MRTRLMEALLAVLIYGAGVHVASAEVPAAAVAVSRSLDYLRTAGESWIAKRDCVSCHQVPSMIWSHQLASRSGIAIPADDLARWEAWSTEVAHFVAAKSRDDFDPNQAMAANIDTMVALLLAMPGDPTTPWRAKYVDRLIQEQAEDGSWKACGQLPMQKRAERETTAVTTLWTTLVLMQQQAKFDRAAALAFADSIDAPESTEWFAARLLVAAACDDERLPAFRQSLLQHQNQDHGWGWLVGDPSDALGTGYALYALAATGAEASVVLGPRQFLLQTQTESGSWQVPGTKTRSKNKPTATAIDWGTAWATVALIESGD